jgi:hypothetical protein
MASGGSQLDLASTTGLHSRKSSSSSVPKIAEGLVKAALEKKRRETSAHLHSEIGGAIDKSLERSRARGATEQEAYDHVQIEAAKVLDGIDKAIATDDQAYMRNAMVAKREALFSVIGVFCLGFPTILTFLAICNIVLPSDFREVLAIGGQDDSLFGATSR